MNNKLLILYASQTGNAMDAAERLSREAEHRGCPAVSVLSIDEFQPVGFILVFKQFSNIYKFMNFIFFLFINF